MPKPMCTAVDKTPARRCSACQIVTINGVRCHERGCPQAWRDERRSCNWCGDNFKPTWKGQRLCSDECAASFWGINHDETNRGAAGS